METNKIAYLIKREDGYHVQEVDGTVGPLCAGVTTDGFIKLSANGAENGAGGSPRLGAAAVCQSSQCAGTP